ncbi:MAG TPA: hypothetical protein VFC05_00900 [Nitrososphaeraceae archaeon]|nr:hypothetical protein [Nitrososphaeraceae archaeon]
MLEAILTLSNNDSIIFLEASITPACWELWSWNNALALLKKLIDVKTIIEKNNPSNPRNFFFVSFN